MVNSEKATDQNVQSMNTEQAELYERIKAFSLDQPDTQLSFSKRLARDNGWSLQYAQQVIEEYQKFVFLAVAAGHPVTPSDQIDQVWHLHLTYTRSYWEEFCTQVLQTPLHHEPTRGGQTENQKFDTWYSKTLESYERFFGQTPPVEIWSTPKERFGRDLYFVRINTQQNWVLPKLQVQRGATTSVAILLTLILSSCYVGNSESNIDPFTVTILATICVGAALGVILFFLELVNFIKNPSRPRISTRPRITKGDDSSSSGCGGGGCGWGNSSDHTSGDFGGSDSSSGCGGGGCGGCGGGGE